MEEITLEDLLEVRRILEIAQLPFKDKENAYKAINRLIAEKEIEAEREAERG